jgi:hypothetical protein
MTTTNPRLREATATRTREQHPQNSHLAEHVQAAPSKQLHTYVIGTYSNKPITISTSRPLGSFASGAKRRSAHDIEAVGKSLEPRRLGVHTEQRGSFDDRAIGVTCSERLGAYHR